MGLQSTCGNLGALAGTWGHSKLLNQMCMQKCLHLQFSMGGDCTQSPFTQSSREGVRVCFCCLPKKWPESAYFASPFECVEFTQSMILWFPFLGLSVITMRGPKLQQKKGGKICPPSQSIDSCFSVGALIKWILLLFQEQSCDCHQPFLLES